MTQSPKKSINVMVDAELYDTVKSLAVSQDSTIKKIVEEALEKLLKGGRK